MAIDFSKYHGTQNDFIICDNRKNQLSVNDLQKLSKLCSRHSGIGADGVLLLENGGDQYDYKMRFVNPDGKEVDFCGNGSRCLYQFAVDQGITNGSAFFEAGDGTHHINKSMYGVRVEMRKVHEIETDSGKKIEIPGEFGLYNSGVDHLVIEVDDVNQVNLDELGWKYRPDGVILPTGINVNIFHLSDGDIYVRTFERGVDAETMSCGTGNVAVAYHLIKMKKIKNKIVTLYPKGGQLVVEFPGDIHDRPWLNGNAVKVYSGIVN